MHTPAMIKRIQSSALLLLLCGSVGNLWASQQPRSTGLPKVNPASVECANIRWHADWLAWYPRIADSCRDVVRVRDQRWARVQATFVRHRPDGAFVSQLLDGNDNLLGGITLLPAVGQGVEIDGRRYTFADVLGEQRLYLYVPEGELVVASQPGAPADQYALIVRTSAVLIPQQAEAIEVADDGLRASLSNVVAAATVNATGAPIKLKRRAESSSSSSSASLASGVLLSIFLVVLVGAVWWLRRQLPQPRRGLALARRPGSVITQSS